MYASWVAPTVLRGSSHRRGLVRRCSGRVVDSPQDLPDPPCPRGLNPEALERLEQLTDAVAGEWVEILATVGPDITEPDLARSTTGSTVARARCSTPSSMRA
jgi:hypothetical protein